MSDPNLTPNERVLYSQIKSLNEQIAVLAARMSPNAPGTPVMVNNKPRINPPAEFKGSREASRPFLGQCELVFDTRPDLYPDNSVAQVQFAASYLRDTAFLWFQAYKTSCLANGIPLIYSNFRTSFLEAFGETDLKAQSTRELDRLYQRGSVTTYATTFNRLAANTGLNDEALQHIFNKGLKEEITSMLLIYDSFSSLSDLQSKATKVDNRLYNLAQMKKGSTLRSTPPFGRVATKSVSQHHTPSSSPAGHAVPMQVDTMLVARSPLSKEEKLRRKNGSLCGYCGESTCGGFPDLSKCTKLAGRPGFQPRRAA